MTSVRLAAVGVLLQLERSRTTLATELERARDGIDDRRDRGLLVELVTGTLRWRGELDAILAAASQRNVAEIDPRTRAVLRLGAYQLRHLDRVPAHAVVHESVEAVRTVGAPRAAGFVNAVLRSIIRRGSSFELPARPSATADDVQTLRYLSTTLSHPEWLAKRWLHREGFSATERWCRFNNTQPDVTVRALPPMAPERLLDHLRAEGLAAAPARFAADAICLAPGSLGRVPPTLRETFVVQDEGSQLVARFARVRPGERVLDVCAAPGGKTLALATDLALDDPASRSRLVAADRRLARADLLASTIRRAGVTIPVVVLDATSPLPFGPIFDCVLVDAPCSGLGTLRRDPDLKWTRQESDLARLASDQRRMLSSTADLVRTGGRLVYATCSSEPEENTEVVDAFLADDARFALATPDSGASWRGLVDDRGYLSTRPFLHHLDAYFAATLVRQRGT